MSSVTRLTLFALISSIEDDLRNEIRLSLTPQRSVEDLFGSDLYKKCVERYNQDTDVTQDASGAQLVDYLDFADAFQLLNRYKSQIASEYASHLQSFTSRLEAMIPIRNRVMHTRPLLFDDLAITWETSRGLTTKMSSFWKHLGETIKRLDMDPSYVLGLVIPPYSIDEEGVSHNLPIPDFDETGFLGRTQQVEELIKTCLGPYPVITIVGEGGIGKTALALRVAYEIVDRNPKPFDYVVWTSSKTTKMTVQEMVRIEGAIQTSVGLIQSVADQLGAKGDLEGESSEILGYLAEFRILLILDNLETVLDDRIRQFLQNLPSGSKVLITSRIGLGALEYPIQLREMDANDSVQLLRALARSRNVEQLVKIPNKRLEKYCSRMKNNPGFIKWFVSAVQAGKRPEEVLSNPGPFLEFCMSNVYEYLSEISRKVLKSMQTIPGDLSQAELAYISGMDDLELQRALQELLTTNMVTMTSVPVGSTYQSSYDVSDLARIYLSKNHPPSSAESKEITKQKNQLIGITQELTRGHRENPYSFFSININSKSDLIVARYLKEALNHNRRGNFEEAEKLLQTAKRLSPEFYEVHRVEAIVNNSQEKLTAAKTCYEAAIELEPNSAPLRLWYAQFLFRGFQDFEEAKTHLLEADRLDPNNFNICLELARLKLILHEFEEAEQLIMKLYEFERLVAWDRRKLVDLKLRLHKDKAEWFCDNRDTKNSLAEFKILVKTYIDCPSELHDHKMREKFRKALPSAIECRNQLRSEKGDLKDMNLVVEWLEKFTITTRSPNNPITDAQNPPLEPEDRLIGHIDKLLNGFGFVVTDGNDRFFFHYSEIADGVRSIALGIGQKVSFSMRTDLKGRICAGNIKIVEE